MSKWTLEGTDIYNGVGFIDLNDPAVLKIVVECVNMHPELVQGIREIQKASLECYDPTYKTEASPQKMALHLGIVGGLCSNLLAKVKE